MHRTIHCALGAAAALFLAAATPARAAQTCNLGNGIKHVVYLQFDNLHLRRDDRLSGHRNAGRPVDPGSRR